MHAFTLTVHTNLFARTLSDEQLANLAEQFADYILVLNKKHGLDQYFSVEISWARGSLLLYIGYAALDPAVWATLGTGIGALTAFFAAYPAAKSGFEVFKQDLRKLVVRNNDVEAKPYDFYFSDVPPPAKAKRTSKK